MNLLRSILPAFSSRAWDPNGVFTFNGVPYPVTGPQQTLTGKREEVGGDFVSLAQRAFAGNPIVFACMQARAMVFSEARFQYQQLTKGRPGDLFATPDLDILETPWPNGITADLLSAMLFDADLAGTAFIYRRDPRTLVRLRPDWVTIVMGSERNADVQAGDLDADTLGYIYHPGGKYSGRTPVPLLREEVAQFQHVRDPLAQYRGMSWLHSLLTEIEADSAASTHKTLFFANGATPNMVVSLDPAVQQQAFDDWVSRFKKAEPDGWKAYKTMYLGGGAKAEVVGANLRQMDFKITQGAGETRIAAAARVPPIIVGLSEGLAAATYSNYGQARRAFADGTIRPLWRNAAGSLSTIIAKKPGARLWYDDRDIPFLREDKADLAIIAGHEATQIRTLTDGGFEPQTVVKAVEAQDWSLLKHTGLLSVQLLPPGTVAKDAAPAPTPPAGRGKVRDANGHLIGIRGETGLEVKCHRCDELHIVTA